MHEDGAGGHPPERLLADALEALDVAVCIADARVEDMPLVWVNDAFTRTTGYRPDQALGRNCRFLQGDLPPQPQVDQVRAALTTASRATVVLRNVRADGSTFLNELSLTPLHDDTGAVTHFLALQRDVTESADQRLRTEQLAQELQATLVPRRLPDAPGLDVAVSFRATQTTDDGTAVSGDFYDLSAGHADIAAPVTWQAVVGDVEGRGPAAAAYTATVRSLLKGISLRGGTPAAVLELLNHALLDELGDRFVTAALAHLHVRRDGVGATLALAGHPEPVLTGDGDAELVGAPGTLLGVTRDGVATDVELDLAPGQTLLLYTDGITESGTVSDQFGQERLLEAASRPADSAQQVVDNVIRAVQQHHGEADDDAALLALRVDPDA